MGTNSNCEIQIGFLTEWQMYAQEIEGDAWRGSKIDKAKIDKMSGAVFKRANARLLRMLMCIQTNRSASFTSLCRPYSAVKGAKGKVRVDLEQREEP